MPSWLVEVEGLVQSSPQRYNKILNLQIISCKFSQNKILYMKKTLDDLDPSTQGVENRPELRDVEVVPAFLHALDGVRPVT